MALMSFKGLKIVSFESRRADDMVNLIEKQDGKAISAPSMRELPLDDHQQALDFAQRLDDGQVDVLVLTTGVGTRYLSTAVIDRLPADQFARALEKVITVARGPKPVAALREIGLKPNVIVPEPNTWRDVLTTLDDQCPVKGKRVTVQEYGVPNQRLIDGLSDRGAEVSRVLVYKWGLPEDLGPMRSAIEGIIAGSVDGVLFTSATQAHHLFKLADQDGVSDQLREAFKKVCIFSVGPVASENIAELGLTVDYEPDSPHMAPLVRESARLIHDLLEKKRSAAANNVDTNHWQRIDMVWAGDNGSGKIPAKTIEDSVMLKACRRQPVPYTPVWIMRQAGRYQRAYRDIRARYTMLELCKSPDVAAEVTLMAVDRLGVDAAIIFSDLLIPLEGLGFSIEFVKGEGPIVHNPVRSREDVDKIPATDVDCLDYVYKAIKITRKALRPDLALIGFAGAPFTVASYLIEGGKSSHYTRTKMLMLNDPQTWNRLMERLADLLAAYLNRQIDAGVDVVQIFDSWIGALSPDDYREKVMPHVQRMIQQVNKSVPLIHFGTGTAALLPLMKQAGGDVIGLDWRVDLAEAWQELGDDVAVMGNLDPIVLYSSPSQIRKETQKILDKAAGKPGHIFNLGHGVLPDMNPQHVADLIQAVHELSAR
jgi:uroporphyrinogen decarboxylase